MFDSKGSAVESSGLDLSKLLDVKKKFGTIKKYGSTNNNLSGVDLIKNIDADVLIETTASNYKDAEPGMTHIIEAWITCYFSKQRTSSVSFSFLIGACNLQPCSVKI